MLLSSFFRSEGPCERSERYLLLYVVYTLGIILARSALINAVLSKKLFFLKFLSIGIGFSYSTQKKYLTSTFQKQYNNLA